MAFVSASPSIVRSVLQRSLLNTWLRLFERTHELPEFDQFSFDRLADEMPDLVWFDVAYEESHPSFTVAHQGRRLADVFGFMPKGADLENFLRPHHVSPIMPSYYQCLLRCRPIYSVFNLPDVDGRRVLYERLLLPFGSGLTPTMLFGSIKTISDAGTFVQKNLMRPDSVVVRDVQAIVDSGFAMSRIEKQLDADVVEI